MNVLAAAAEHDGTGILRTILLIAVIIAFIIGLAEAIGITSFAGRTGNGRYGTLLVAVILLIVYLIV